MSSWIGRWEAFLRLERLAGAAELFKARTVYVTGIAFLFVQILNGMQMYVSYGGWILDHTLLVVAIGIFTGAALSLRYQANFDFISVLWGVAILCGVAGSAIPSKVGINSALLPVMVCGVVIIAILGSRRSLLIYCLSAGLLTAALHFNAAEADLTVLADPGYVALRNMQRTMQTGIAIVLVGAVMGVLSYTLNNLFMSLEHNVAEARAAEAAKTQFLADMSHELRTPLNGVLGMNQLLMRSDLTEEQRRYAGIIDDCGTGMIMVIDDVLDLSRLEASKISLKPSPFNPARMLDSVIALHQANAKAKGLALHLRIEPGLPPLFMGDQGRLRQIVGNLISNAVKFTDMGHVAVSLRGQPVGPGQWWLNIFVQDTGIGIPPERINRVFERFEQAQDGQTNTVRGSGLGLAICRELTDLFGGQISVTSSPGEGSAFCVALPFAVVEVDNPAQDRRSTDRPESRAIAS